MATTPNRRNAKMLVYLVATCFMVLGILDLGLYGFKSWHDHVRMHLGRSLWLAVPIFIGIGILIKSSALAARIEEFLDE